MLMEIFPGSGSDRRTLRWRVVRASRPFALINPGDDSLAAYYVETALPSLVPSQRAHFARLASELQRRREAHWQLLVVQADRAWDRAWERSRELPALDYGQDGDELLQDVADYYADSRACPVCGAEMDWIECDHCGGEGGRDNDALMEEDPLWYDGVEWEDCTECGGKGGWWQCYRAPHSEVRREQ